MTASGREQKEAEGPHSGPLHTDRDPDQLRRSVPDDVAPGGVPLDDAADRSHG